MRRALLFMLVASGLVVSVPQLFAQNEPQTSANVSNILQIVDSEPLVGQELELAGDITIFFDRALDCATVEGALSIQPFVESRVNCDAASITFAPTETLERANTYQLRLSQTLRGADGAQLLEPYALRLDTVGFLRVAESFPARDAEAVAPDTTVTLIFNRPVVPLVIEEEADTLPNPLTLSPAVTGSGEWINTSIYQFTPDIALAGGVEYEVRVAAGLTTPDEAILAEDFVLTFTTQGPEILELNPRPDESRVRLDRRVQATFNQPMDRQSVEANFILLAQDTQSTVSGTFEWSDDNTGFAFIPDDDLQLGNVYVASLFGDVVSANGGAPLEGRTEWIFATLPFPRIVNTFPNDGALAVQPYSGFEIDFASPMDAESLEGLITIEPATITEPEGSYRSFSDTYTYNFLPFPDVTYTITVAPGAQDIYGNTITEPYTFSYTTGGYEPEVRLEVPRNVGFYNAYRDPTQIFLSYRNVNTIDLELYNIPLDRFLERPGSPQATPEDLLRRWSVESAAPRNALRYDLLEFDESTADASTVCPGSLPSRLAIGDIAVVSSEPDPARARSAPLDGEIIELLYRDYALPIIGGPVCEGDLVWWEVELRDGQAAWVAESVADEYLLELRTAGDAEPVTIELAQEDGGLPPGIYYLSTDSEDTFYRPAGHTMIVATANLVIKNTVDRMLVWATDVQSGQPIVGETVQFYDGDGELIGSAVTDADGIASVLTPRVSDLYITRSALLTSERHFGVGLTYLSNGIDPFRFGQDFDYYPRQFRAYLYTDRPVYRPGQPVYFRGIVRDKSDMDYTPAQFDTVPVTVRDDRGETVYQADLPLTPYGSFSAEFELAEDAALGFYYLSVELPDSSRIIREGGGVSFSVAEYRRPEFQVEVAAAEPEIVQGADVDVTIDATYFFGGSVSNATVTYSVLSRDHFFRYDGPGFYDFTDFNRDGGPSSFFDSQFDGIIADGTARTNDSGEFTLSIPADIASASQSQNFTIEAVVTDETDQTVAGRTDVIVHQGEVYVGLRPERYVGRAGAVTALEVISVDWDSDAVANQTVEYEIVERLWSSVQEQDASGRTVWSYEVENVPVEDGTGTIVTNSNGVGRIEFVPPNGGVYKTTIRTRDTNGNEVVASTFMWVASSNYVSWRQQNSNRIDLIADQENYAVGDTAEILITSPFQGTAEALITVERGDILLTERVTMTSNSLVYELPITEDFAPNAFVSVMIVKGVDETNPVAGFRMGYVQIGVDPERKALAIDITSDVDRTSPQETVTYTVRTSDWTGQPISAEVGIGVTDLAVLSLAPSNSRPIFNHFYGDQQLSVRTSTPLTINTDQLTQEILDTVKGGGGGLAVDGVIEIRGEFIDTPFWNGAIVTDENGTATFDVRLPDNLTTWRLDARGVTLAPDGEMLVGQETFDLLSTKPLLIRPVTPRFFVIGDRTVLAAVVNNNTETAQEAVVTINNDNGVTVMSERSQVVTVPAGGSARVEWDVVVNDAPSVEMSFVADAGQFTDGSISPVSIDDEGTLPIYRYEVPETVGTAGTLSTTDTRVESIVLPRRFDVTQGELIVQVDQSLAATTLDGLDYLRNYPHQCIEQTVSRFLPNIMTARALSSLPVQNDALTSNLDLVVNQALQKLLAEQKADGGWGWFRNDRSNSLTTAYALIGLYEAQQQGYVVSDFVISEAQRYLSNNLVTINDRTTRWRLNRQAFMLYALARTEAPDIGRTAVLYDNRALLSVYARAYLGETLNYIDPTDTTRINTIVSELVDQAIFSAAGVHWEEDYRDFWNWNTNTRTNAIVLSALVKLRPQSDLIPNAVRYLMVQRSADAWETTQETAWAVMALTDWMIVSGELEPDYGYDVSLNDETLLRGQATDATVFERNQMRVNVSELLQDEANRLIFTRTGSNDGALYYTTYLEAFLPVPEVEALDSGISIQRRYTLQGNDEAITQGRVGDIVQVRLTIIAPNDLHYVVVEDPLPAGAEAVDPNLSTSQQIGTRPGLDSADPLRFGWGWWYFSEIDFRDEKMQMYSTYLPAGTYEYVYTMRLGVAGEYNVIPATAEEFYFPDVHGRTAGSTFTILPADA